MLGNSTMFAAAVFLMGAGLASVSPAADGPQTIENERLQVTFDAATSSVSLRAKPSGMLFLSRGQLSGSGGTARVAAAVDPHWGEGQELLVSYPDGNRDSIRLFPQLPLAIFRSTLHNGGEQARVVDRVRTFSAELALGQPRSACRAFGTGGLTAVEQNPGSYAYLAIVDPASRAGLVGGWLTHQRGSGVVFSPVDGETTRLEARLDYGRLRIAPGQDAELESFAIGWFDDARQGLETYADAVARIHAIRLPPQPAGYCTWYADKHGGACDEQHLAELAEFAAAHLKPFGFEFVQIDDHWQAGVSTNGPRRNFTTHRADGPYPSGMRPAAEQLRQRGLTPGIWFMPFAGTHEDPFFREHQDWFAKDGNGQPFETRWGGTCLDMTVPGAREHLRSVVHRLAHEWGYRLFKMDGLWTGTATRLMYVNNGYADDQIGEARLADADKTHIEAYRDGLRLVREVAGAEVYLLGCCVSQNMRSFGGSFGLVDAMRVGPDTGAGHIGAPHGSRNYFLHGRVWHNDPDCVSVRASTPLDQARLNASWTAISGQLFYNSDWLPDLPPERLDILRRTLPAHGLLPRPVDLFEADPARIWLLSDTRRTPRRDVLAVYNWDPQQAATIPCVLDRIGLPAGEYVGFDFWDDKFVPPFREARELRLPPASCRVLALRPVAGQPQLLSTSRHVTQGMVDVLEEQWDAAAQTLRGTSCVVADDPYELRIVLPTGADSWRACAAAVSPEDASAGVAIAYRQDGPRLRAAITSPASRPVRWQVRFEPVGVEAPPPSPVADLRAAVEYGAVLLGWQEADDAAYRITRSDGVVFEVTAARLLDRDVAHGTPYVYRVQALGWNGEASQPATVEVRTPDELKRPPTPELPQVYLGDLQPVRAQVGWGQLHVDASIEGQPLAVEGQRYQRGIGVHAHSLLVYAIPAGARRFVALVGLDDEKRDDPRSSVAFEVYGDVQEMGEAPVLLAASPVLSDKTLRGWAFDIELGARYKQLRLVVTDAADGIAADHADWINAGFVIP